MTLGMKVGLGLGDFVMDGDQATPRKEDIATPPNFWPMFIVPNGWMDEDATWYESRPRPRPHCIIRRGPSSPRQGHSSPPLFGPCLLWPRSPISATPELFTCSIARSATRRYLIYSEAILWVFAPQGRHDAPIGVKCGTEDGGLLLRAKFHPDRCNG